MFTHLICVYITALVSPTAFGWLLNRRCCWTTGCFIHTWSPGRFSEIHRRRDLRPWKTVSLDTKPACTQRIIWCFHKRICSSELKQINISIFNIQSVMFSFIFAWIHSLCLWDCFCCRQLLIWKQNKPWAVSNRSSYIKTSSKLVHNLIRIAYHS